MDFRLETQWHETLKQELKTDQLAPVLSHISHEGLSLPILSKSEKGVELAFNRAPLSVKLFLESDVEEKKLHDWYSLGVGDFFIDEKIAEKKKNLLDAFLNQTKARIFCSQHVFNHERFITPVSAYQKVAFGVSQVAQLSLLFSQKEEVFKKSWVEVYLDNQFFKNIALVRALKLFFKDHPALHVIGRVHLRDFSLLNSEANILKNTTSVMSGYLSGVSAMESCSYDVLIDQPEIHDEALWLSVSSQLILQAESHLQFAHDPGSHSGTIEMLTQTFYDAALKEAEKKSLTLDLQKKAALKKYHITGVNDYPSFDQKLPKSRDLKFARTAEPFEQLRFRMKNLKKKPKFGLVLMGDEARLQARLMFVQNTLDLLGDAFCELKLEIWDQEKFLSWKKNHDVDIVVLVAQDQDYASVMKDFKTEDIILAGKTHMETHASFFAGQDIIQFFHQWLDQWEKRV
jgi:hypothetical protein